jgi:UPF0176 protein
MKNLHNRVSRTLLKERLEQSDVPRKTISFYKYAKIGNTRVFRDHMFILLSEIDVMGRIYVAHEGVNGQISVPIDNVDQLREKLDQITFLEGCRLNTAIDDNGKSFIKLAIKIRAKIVADGIEDESFDVTNNGKHINASELNELVESKNTILIDMRNHYESEVGHFRGAIRPDVETFRESLPIIEEVLNENRDKNVIMYCTGGIRCEKATAYFKHKGFDNLYQVDGGIIEYARKAKELGIENKFIGKNFVFDDRLGERISDDVIAHCHQCGDPCDDHTNCANDACHILFIQCKKCAAQYEDCCSHKCQEFNKLPEDDRSRLKGTTEFNGTKFGKGRYKVAKEKVDTL